MRLEENAVVAGRFRLNRLLTRGGMGSVWHATHLGLDIPCAVKFVKGELLDNEDVVSRFEREAKAAAQLRSPHVVQILDHGVCDGTPYIAMELLDGEDLDGRLRRVGRLAPEELHRVMNDVCRALSKAHALGIIHRDLKPGNIFIVRDDDREIVKVLDFGIAKTSRANDISGSATKTGAMLGTPYYMSPEQAQGTKAVDARSDLWALAVIAFQCLTGQLPFVSEALGDLLMKIMVAPIPVPSQVAPVPPAFDRWWAKASSRDPAERIQSAKEFSDSLAVVCGISQVSSVIDRGRLRIETQPAIGAQPMPPAFANPPPTGAPTPPPPAAPTPPPAESPIGATRIAPPTPVPGVASATTTSSVAGVTPPPLSRSVAQDPATPPPKKGGLGVPLTIGAVLLAAVLGGVGWFAFRGRTVGTTATATTTAFTATPTATTAAPRETAAPAAQPPAAPSGTTTAAPTEAWPSSLPTTPTPTATATATAAPSETATAAPAASTTPSTASTGKASKGSSHTAPATTVAKPGTPAPAPAKPQSTDLGF